jgi:hypothetical protein
MEQELENLALNEETDGQEQPETDVEDVAVLKQQKEDLAAKNKQLFERAKKAEGFEKNSDGRWVKAQKPEVELKPQSSEPDYAKLAYLETKGFTHPDDQKVIQDEAVRLKLPLTDVMGMEHIKSKLQMMKDQRESMAGMPKGAGRGGGKTQQDVDYWLAKGETPDDQELAAKVIEARIQKETKGNMFSDDLYTG